MKFLVNKVIYLGILLGVGIHSLSYAQLTFQYAQLPVLHGNDTLFNAWAGGLNSGVYNTIDLDGDNQEDLVILDRTSNRILTFLNKENKYTYAPIYASLFPADRQNWMLLVDYNSDGRKDLFVASGSRGIRVYKNQTREAENVSWSLVADPLLTLGFSGFTVSLQVGPADVPAITDADGDGDQDIIVYNVNGRGNLEFYQNVSTEKLGHSDSLIFEATDNRWGGVKECDCNQFAFGTEECNEVIDGARVEINQKEQHIGGKSILAIDVDGDQDKDLLIGHEECAELYFLRNEGSVTQPRFESFESQFPNEVFPANFFVFPSAFYEDADLDGIKDLIVSPNAGFNISDSINFTASSWLYQNTKTNEYPEFSFNSRSFLQEEMIDVGENAVPALADVDNDGDMDLLVGNRGILHQDGFYGGITCYENTGTYSQPVFTLKTADFAQMNALKLRDVKVYFSDLQADGLPEMVITGSKTSSGQGLLYIFENSQAFPFQFDVSQPKTINFNFNVKDNFAFFDVDNDGRQDLFLGKQNGDLEYYHNTGEGLDPVWHLENEHAGNISGNTFSLFLSPLLYDLDQNGEADLISTNISGKLLVRSDFVANLEQPQFLRTDTATIHLNGSDKNIEVGEQTWLAAADLFGNGTTTLLIGHREGGISLLNVSSEKEKPTSLFLVYPNPSEGIVQIQTDKPIVTLQIINIKGQLLYEEQLAHSGTQVFFNTDRLSAGLYLIRVLLENGEMPTSKLIIP